jgi:hypothetical protein
MAALRLGGGRRIETVGDPRSTVYFTARGSRTKLARVYDRNLRMKRGEPYGLVRLEAQWMFKYGQVPLSTITPGALANLWLLRFGRDEIGGTVERLGRETQTLALAERVRRGEIKAGQAGRISFLLDLERKGVARSTLGERIYGAWSREARKLGLAKSVLDDGPVSIDLAGLIHPARAIWDAYLLPYLQPPDDLEA